MESFTNEKNIGDEVIVETTRSKPVTVDEFEFKDNLFGTEEGVNLRWWCIGVEA